MSNIKATFTAGMTEATVHGLHQWDYGRSLEIAHPDLPAEMEVHFAGTSSKEAIVHVVAGINGVATVAIPNTLLEQAHPITAWVYRIGGTLGETILTVTMPIQARPRPAVAPSVPEEISDKYTEALGAINTQVEALKGGNVMVASAANATHADRATEADTATTADKATGDKNGNDIATTYQKKDRGGYQPTMYLSRVAGRLYQFRVVIGEYTFYATASWETGAFVQVALGYAPVKVDTLTSRYCIIVLCIDSTSAFVQGIDSDGVTHEPSANIMFREI